MKEYNLFELIGRLIAFLRKGPRRNRTGFCPKTRAGHFSISFLWLRYTLTDSELIIRTFGVRRIALKDLRIWSRVTPPEVRPGQRIRFTLECAERVTLRLLGHMPGHTHFVMLLGEAAGLDLITPFLGVEASSAMPSGL